ncbi:Wadjet anti-phage system protein JetD domain-containing protein [Neobacillus drentensis]|uniref:Wadjet anti-phage system protein JetD domain-containing protein n=1 Tax=Neobacillus drentensis TaxID=220684 RepID=UPI002FFF6FED
MKDKMKAWLVEYLKSIQLPTRRKKFHIQQLEDYLIKDMLKDPIRYQAENGYQYFVQIMHELAEGGVVSPVKKSHLNGRRPSLITEWWLEKATFENQWSDMQVLAVSDALNLTKYRQHPEWQTDMEWQRIQSIYTFLKQKDQYSWVTREERSFQLFGEEKFLSNDGSTLLQRLQLNLEDMKARVYGEPFAFWPAPNADIRNPKSVLIVENQSLYHTCRLLMNSGKDVSGIHPDLLIYGEGKKIEKSFNFLHDISNGNDLIIYYVGDIDPEGWGIYIRLKDSYPDANIQLAVPIYESLLNKNLTNKTETNQNEKSTYLNRVMQEFELQGRSDLAAAVLQLWELKLRVPQEVLSLDTI